MDERVIEMKADVLKVLAQPTRLKILECLRNGEDHTDKTCKTDRENNSGQRQIYSDQTSSVNNGQYIGRRSCIEKGDCGSQPCPSLSDAGKKRKYSTGADSHE